jgi:hypothetical protein
VGACEDRGEVRNSYVFFHVMKKEDHFFTVVGISSALLTPQSSSFHTERRNTERGKDDCRLSSLGDRGRDSIKATKKRAIFPQKYQ